MKAVRINEFGGVGVLKIEDTKRPIPAADEILIRVYASGINPVDLVIREGKNAALNYHLTLPMTLGWDAAGVIEDLGKEVTEFQKGDSVYGVPNFPGDGSYAEYCVAKATRFALKPTSLNFNEAAGVPLIALTAWTGMFEYGKLQPGQRILIQGASGGVGGCAVQFAKAKGAYVIGVATKNNFDYLRSLGVDEMIDYTTQKFEDLLQDIDLVLEASSVRDNNERLKSVSVLKQGGIFVSVNTDFPFNKEVEQALVIKNAKGALAANQPRKEWLEEIAQLIDKGEVKVAISKIFPLEKVAEAHIGSETKQIQGKLVLEVRKENEQL
jgi:NADPH:quinone reductase-like Zn-dependent oxidoreductase